jgi:hypothetical protein
MDTGEFEKPHLILQESANRDRFTKTTSRVITVFLVLGIFCAIIPSPLALGGAIIGVIVLIISIRRGVVKYYGYVAAIIALLSMMSFLFYAVVIKTNTRNRREYEKNHTLIYNLKKIGGKLQMYANDNNGYLPSSENWCDILLQYDSNLTQKDFRHPDNPAFVIAFNKNLGGAQLANIPKDTVLIFETRGSWNLSGDEELIQAANSNDSRVNILFTNMVVKSYWIKEKAVHGCWLKEFVPVRWKP